MLEGKVKQGKGYSVIGRFILQMRSLGKVILNRNLKEGSKPRDCLGEEHKS